MAYLLDRKHKPCRSVSQVYNRRVESTKYVHVLFRPPRGPLASAASEWHKRPGEAPGEVACRTSRSSAAAPGSSAASTRLGGGRWPARSLPPRSSSIGGGSAASCAARS